MESIPGCPLYTYMLYGHLAAHLNSATT